MAPSEDGSLHHSYRHWRSFTCVHVVAPQCVSLSTRGRGGQGWERGHMTAFWALIQDVSSWWSSPTTSKWHHTTILDPRPSINQSKRRTGSCRMTWCRVSYSSESKPKAGPQSRLSAVRKIQKPNCSNIVLGFWLVCSYLQMFTSPLGTREVCSRTLWCSSGLVWCLCTHRFNWTLTYTRGPTLSRSH